MTVSDLVEVLDTDEGAKIVDLLKVAKDWNQPPLTVLAGRPPKWRVEDTMLAQALQGYEQTRLDANGFPTRLSENEEVEEAWDVDGEIVNFAAAALEQWRKDNPKPAPGVTPKIVFHPTINPDKDQRDSAIQSINPGQTPRTL